MLDKNKRYQVFISSTYLDLKAEREEVIKALLELHCIPAGMELFPASDEERWALIRRVIDDCDYYIVIVGGRYGSLDEGGVSYTEREYDYALSQGLPVLGFVHGEPDKIEAGKTEPNQEGREKLEAFRAKVEQRMCKKWRTAEDLGGAVSRSLVQQIMHTPGTGWVRGDEAMSPETAEELAVLRLRVTELESELARPATEPPAAAEDFAKGDDQFSIDVDVKRGPTRSGAGTITYTWNELAALLGPLMFDEAAEGALKGRLEEDIVNTWRRTEDFENRFGTYAKVEVNNADFHTIKVQLAALGIIEKSIRRRGVKDANTYWKLSPYGESLVMQLTAIKKGDTLPQPQAKDTLAS